MKIIPFLIVASLSSLHAQNYTVTNLGTLGGRRSEPKAINSSGVVVGSIYLGSSDESEGYAALFGSDGASGSKLGTLGGYRSTANAINASGTIVGGASIVSGNYKATRFGTNGAANTDLGGLGGGTYSGATSINASGTIVGFATPLIDNRDYYTRAVLFSGNGTNNIDLSSLAARRT